MRQIRRWLCVLSFLLLLLSAASLAQVGNTPRPAPATRVTAILSAMTVEIETLGQELTDKKEMTVQGIRFTTGSLKDRRVVLAHSGIGKVNAAMAATLLVEQFQPTHVLFTGIAGGLNPDLRPGDVVIGAKTAYHDYGEWTPEGFRVGRTVDPFTGKLNPSSFPPTRASWPWPKGRIGPQARAREDGLRREDPAGRHGGDRDGRCVCGLAREEGRAAQRVQSRRDRDGRHGGGADLLAAARAVPDPTQPQ